MVNNIDDDMRSHWVASLPARAEVIAILRRGTGNTRLDLLLRSFRVGTDSIARVLELLDHLDALRLTRAAPSSAPRRRMKLFCIGLEDASALGAGDDVPASMQSAFEGPNVERVSAKSWSRVDPMITDLDLICHRPLASGIEPDLLPTVRSPGERRMTAAVGSFLGEYHPRGICPLGRAALSWVVSAAS